MTSSPNVLDLAAILRPISPRQEVYPLYLASRVKRGLWAAESDAEQIIGCVGDIQSLGNSRYAIPVTDRNGTKYRVTVEVVA